jgi:hypothetical protein
MNNKNKIDWDKLPVTLETSAYRKTSDDFTFVLVTPRKYEAYAKSFMSRLSSMGVVFFVACSSDSERDSLLQEPKEELKGIGDGTEPKKQDEKRFVPLEIMAQVLGMTPRNVQLHAEKGMLIRTTRGQYDTLLSCGSLWKAYKALETGKNENYNQQRLENLEKKNRELDRLHAVEMKKLVPADDVQRAREIENGNIRQKFLYLKALAPQLEGRTVNEIEKRLNEYALKCLGELDRSENADIREGMDEEEQQQLPKKNAKKKKRND